MLYPFCIAYFSILSLEFVESAKEPADPHYLTMTELIADTAGQTNIIHQLDGTTRPIQYWLDLKPNLNDATFDGQVIIKILATVDTAKIRFNSQDHDIERVSVRNFETYHKMTTQYTIKSNGRITITIALTKLLANNYYRVKVVFKGRMSRNNPFGFAIHRTEDDGSRMAETVFDPFFASKVFPCYDNPQFRAPIKINIIEENVPPNNVPSFANFTGKQLRQIITTDVTDSLPTHTYYFAILGNGYCQRSNGHKYFVWTTEKYLDQTDYALKHLQMAGERMKQLFSTVEYDLPRIDLVVPVRNVHQPQFMRFMKRNFLCDERFCSHKHQEEVTKDIIRQVSNKWFDQYVSINSWQFLWLRDGLATYYGYELTQMMKPSWRMSDLHGSLTMQSVLHKTNNFHKHLMDFGILGQDSLFERIYSPKQFSFYDGKASLIFRMLKHTFGESIFNKVMQRFLKLGHDKEGLIRLDTLAEAFELILEEDGVDWKSIMPYPMTMTTILFLWTTQLGYPILNAVTSPEGYIIVEQYSRHEDIWALPITLTTQTNANFDNTKPIAWSFADKRTKTNTAVRSDEWYILNLQNTALFRTNYPPRNWIRLIHQLVANPKIIHHLNRVQIITDSHVLAIDYDLSLSIPICLTAYLPNEDDPVVWLAAFHEFRHFYLQLGSKTRPIYQKYITSLLKHEYLRTGFHMKSDDDHATRLWRSELVNYLCWIRDIDCVDTAERAYDYYDSKNDLTRVDPDLQYVVFCTALRGDDPEKVDNVRKALEKLSKNHNNVCLRENIRRALNCRLTPKNKPHTYDDYTNLMDQITTVESMRIVVNDLLTNWDSTLSLLELIDAAIERVMVNRRTTDDEKKYLLNLIESLSGKIRGVVERRMLLKMKNSIRPGDFRTEYHSSLTEAIRRAADDTDSNEYERYKTEKAMETLSRFLNDNKLPEDYEKCLDAL